MTRATPLCAILAYLALVAGFTMPTQAEESISSTTVSGTEAALEPPPTITIVRHGENNPTTSQAEMQFKQAQEAYKAMAAGTAPTPNTEGYEAAVFSDPNVQFHAGSDDVKNVTLGNIRLVIDVEDVTLRTVMNDIITQAAQHSGAWTVKWRLKPENAEIPNEKVNITAESNFEDFVARLTERVRNLTGVGLYVTAFEGSRIILITDTFY